MCEWIKYELHTNVSLSMSGERDCHCQNVNNNYEYEVHDKGPTIRFSDPSISYSNSIKSC